MYLYARHKIKVTRIYYETKNNFISVFIQLKIQYFYFVKLPLNISVLNRNLST